MGAVVSLADFERGARRRLPRFLFDFVASGADGEHTLTANRAAFTRTTLIPRVLRDVSARDPATTLFGSRFASPFGIAPMGGVELCIAGGDVAMARAAAAASIPMILSGASFTPLEDVALAASGLWFQPLLPLAIDDAEPLLERAQRAEIGALVVTADLAVAGRREADLRNGFGHPLQIGPALVMQALRRPRWLMTTGRRFLRGTPTLPNLAPVSAGRPPPMAGLDLPRLAALRARWAGPIIVKGVLAADDARRCIAAGADGIIVSNHGGRQLDGSIATLDALEAVKAAAGNHPVLLDGGIWRGTDVIKALATGADAVFVGRAFLDAIASDGAQGLATAIALLAAEVDRAMALCGCATIDEIDHSLIARPGGM